MFVSFKMKYEGIMVPGGKRVLNKIMKAALQEAGIFWHQKFSAKHFTVRGAREYGYLPRKGEQAGIGSRAFFRSYTGQKLKRFGHRLPLVFTGESRKLARIRDVRATSKRARIVIHARALNFRPKDGRINMRDEMTRMSTAERKRLVSIIKQSIINGINNLKNKSTKRIAA